MPRNRLDASKVTPSYEDAGLFKNKVSRLTVELLPQMFRNHRQDVLVTGLVQGGLQILVLFAGRRTVEAAPIITNLKMLRSRILAQSGGKEIPSAALASIRLPVHIEGAWRPRVQRDHNGWEQRSYHLIAARWAIKNDKGLQYVFGQRPVAFGSQSASTT